MAGLSPVFFPTFLADLSSPYSNLKGLLINLRTVLSFKALVGPSTSLKSIKQNPLHLPVSSKVAILIFTISPQCLKCSSNSSSVVSNDRFPTNKILEGGFFDNCSSALAGLPSKELASLISSLRPFKFSSESETALFICSSVLKSMYAKPLILWAVFFGILTLVISFSSIGVSES